MPHFAQISSKGQLVIPAELRDEMALEAGTKVSIEREGGALVLRPITAGFIRKLRGSTHGAAAARERSHRDHDRR